MLAEKCPNCGAFLPVRRAGVAVRTCEFCELEVPGEVVDVERLTTERPAVQPSDWLPQFPPVHRVEAVGRAIRRGVLTVFIVILVGTGILIGGIFWFIKRTTDRALALVPKVPVPAEAPTAEATAPPPRPGMQALTAAVTAAGGVHALDPLALLPFADRRAHAAAADAVLLSLQCFPVVDGKADLGLAGGRCSYEYRSPAGTTRPADVPVGVSYDYPCALELDVDEKLDQADARVSKYSLDMCRQHHAVRPPRCTTAEVWTRATAAGVPAGAAARMRYAGRYRSGYDPIDPTDEVDRPERGRWTVEVERDGAPDIRAELADDCGREPPTADDKAVLAAIKRATPALFRCFGQAAGRERSVEALEMIWRLAIDAGGAVTIAFEDPGVDIEGIFEGDLDAIRTRWAACADKVAPTMKLPPALHEVRLELRLTQDGKLTVPPPPYASSAQ